MNTARLLAIALDAMETDLLLADALRAILSLDVFTSETHFNGIVRYHLYFKDGSNLSLDVTQHGVPLDWTFEN